MADDPRPPDSYWVLLGEVARLQADMARTFAAWSEAYAASGRALEGTADALGRMADLGQRMEDALRDGPSAAAQQALQFIMNPLQAMSGMPIPGSSDAIARFWEQWLPVTREPGGQTPPRPAPASPGSPEP